MTENQDKGRIFEDYIYSRLDREISAKRIREGAFSYPDIRCTSSLKGETFDFAVECKFRKATDGEIRLLDSKKQWEKYKTFHRKEAIMFIALGIGDNPADPDRVFIVPLMYLRGLYCSIEHLHLFEHWDKSKYIKFYHNSRTLR